MEKTFWERQTSYYTSCRLQERMDSKLRSCVSFQKHTGDYHDEMNGEHFLDWFENRLMHNVPERSVIVLDNAPYHNVVLEKVPTKSSTKTMMKEWLTSKNIAFEDTDLKSESKLVCKDQRRRFQKETVSDECSGATTWSYISSVTCCSL